MSKLTLAERADRRRDLWTAWEQAEDAYFELLESRARRCLGRSSIEVIMYDNRIRLASERLSKARRAYIECMMEDISDD